MAQLNNQRPRWLLPLLPIHILVAIPVVFSEVVRPMYRWLLQRVSTASFVGRLSKFIATLPRAVILILFAVPFAIAEPLKIFALFLIGQRHLVAGLGIIVLAYLLSFVVVEQIYQAGREKLLTYALFKWVMDRVKIVQDWFSGLKSGLWSRIRRWSGRPA